MTNYTILVCDDDPEIRRAMRRTLNRYRVIDVATPQEAMLALRVGSFDAVVTDFDLGSGSDGLELLQTVKLLYPDMVRFLVTGNQDLTVAVRAVNEGAVHRYLLKPWDDDKVVTLMEIALHGRLVARGAEAS
ncbi:MAG: response regulator [Kofleriaceae bacterium]|jgi:DNA-binding NtrC family response regulator|nr:response regulator [Kofleriaceae bacterium]MBP6835831.1 response regulator [Kofleriaceae bacterium]MBP9206924.1 response regulator [Kofleriaceae bacterium]